MLSRSRSELLLSIGSIFLIVTMIAGCAGSKKPKTEIRIPRQTLTDANAWGDESQNQQQQTVAATAETPSFGSNEWQPAGAPPEDSLSDSSTVSMGEGDAFGAESMDEETGAYKNDASTEGVEDGSFVSELEMVHFPFDSSEIAPEFATVLDQHASWIQNHPTAMVQVEGHCDERGTEEYNISLGQRRADSVRSYLIEQGVDPDRLSTISYGKMRPLTFELNEEAHALNRRAMFLVYEVPEGSNDVAAAF